MLTVLYFDNEIFKKDPLNHIMFFIIFWGENWLNIYNIHVVHC